MGTIQRDPIVKNVLKNLCCSYGWCYGVFWSFEQPNSIFLTMQDTYYEEKFGGLIEELRLQVPILGGGIIGQAAFSKKHQWISLENPNTRLQDSSNSTWDMFLDDSEFHSQFSCGIKTVAAISVEPQGVVHFGSTQKVSSLNYITLQQNQIMETSEFVDQTKRLFEEIVNARVLENASCSSENSQSCPANGLFPYLISSEDAGLVGPASSSAGPSRSCSFSSNSQAVLVDRNEPVTWLQPNNLFPFQESLVSESRNLESWSAFPTQCDNSLPLTNKHQDLLDFGIPDEILQTGDFDISQWIPPSPVQTNDLISQTEELVRMTSEVKTGDFVGSTGNWGGVLMPVNNGTQLNFHSYKSIKHTGNDRNSLGPRKGLFSELGIEKLLEGLSCTSNAMPPSCIEDRVSSAVKRMKTGNSMSSLQPQVVPKSEPGVWMANAYSMNCVSRVSQAKKEVEPHKTTVKKAKPGTRPRPKDRQQILDRMAELRELIPNGDKMSIDCLLDRTIKHMLFLQSVTKHADRVKQADKPKNYKNNDPSSNGATWACELGNQTMVCPLIVEDLSTPGHMLIEMLCEEQGFFLEMVGIIRGFGLIILNGVMEVREKIWARFIVESEAKRHVTRHEVFSALVRLLQVTCLDGNQVPDNVIEATNPLLDSYQQSLVQSLPDTEYCINL
ncbi:hypothetical protein OSB04_010467 [Centaurea solstitialis]|uniref:BHLH domain-containing protein n=1 Tax=Centaurea solstitialis TaxID=347529 RepID=A0AA38T7M1_9ASTR|nr:hypothetical protein OSB04_010467 [Centaurea solstitialis]